MNAVHDRRAVYALVAVLVIGCHKTAPAPTSIPAEGLAYLYAFNHDEAIRHFERAANAEPDNAMAYWGIAIANGPHINNPLMDEKQTAAATNAIADAAKRKRKASERDRALIEALEKRYAGGLQNEAYANAMRDVRKRFPDDPDVGSLFAESLLMLRPWDQWTKDGKAQPGTEEILSVLDDVLKKSPQHLLANHLYVHALEASPTPERADQSANRLRTLAPELGHLLHMPSHIDVRMGRWDDAIATNAKAIEADAKLRRPQVAVPQQSFYNLYSAHNHHMTAFAAMMSGQKTLALGAIRRLIDEMPQQWLSQRAMIADGLHALPYEVLLRFGEWDAVLAEPELPEYLPLSRALRLYARGVALAAKGDVAAAREEQKRFREQSKLAEEARFGSNAGKDLVAVADAFLEGEILYREKKIEAALEQLREAVKREDALNYDEPPDWIQPARHALGAILLENNKLSEAEEVYRADLVEHPNNGWSLFGLASALRAQNKNADDVEKQFHAAWAKADAKITSSCLCVPSTSR
jgi:tetratricopeptide (TPR) repeat protein